jgi:hypothetical protein
VHVGDAPRLPRPSRAEGRRGHRRAGAPAVRLVSANRAGEGCSRPLRHHPPQHHTSTSPSATTTSLPTHPAPARPRCARAGQRGCHAPRRTRRPRRGSSSAPSAGPRRLRTAAPPPRAPSPAPKPLIVAIASPAAPTCRCPHRTRGRSCGAPVRQASHRVRSPPFRGGRRRHHRAQGPRHPPPRPSPAPVPPHAAARQRGRGARRATLPAQPRAAARARASPSSSPPRLDSGYITASVYARAAHAGGVRDAPLPRTRSAASSFSATDSAKGRVPVRLERFCVGCRSAEARNQLAGSPVAALVPALSPSALQGMRNEEHQQRYSPLRAPARVRAADAESVGWALPLGLPKGCSFVLVWLFSSLP